MASVYDEHRATVAARELAELVGEARAVLVIDWFAGLPPAVRRALLAAHERGAAAAA